MAEVQILSPRPAFMARSTEYEKYMELALEQAEAAARLGEVPVGAVIVHDGNVIARAHNRREIAQDPLAHAEILCLSRAAKALGTWRLSGAAMYVTLEPCPMCAGALINARVDKLIYGCSDPKAGAVRTLYALCEDPRLNHRVEVVRGVLSERCAGLLSEFFAKLRARAPTVPGKKKARIKKKSASFSTVVPNSEEKAGEIAEKKPPAKPKSRADSRAPAKRKHPIAPKAKPIGPEKSARKPPVAPEGKLRNRPAPRASIAQKGADDAEAESFIEHSIVVDVEPGLKPGPVIPSNVTVAFGESRPGLDLSAQSEDEAEDELMDPLDFLTLDDRLGSDETTPEPIPLSEAEETRQVDGGPDEGSGEWGVDPTPTRDYPPPVESEE